MWLLAELICGFSATAYMYVNIPRSLATIINNDSMVIIGWVNMWLVVNRVNYMNAGVRVLINYLNNSGLRHSSNDGAIYKIKLNDFSRQVRIQRVKLRKQHVDSVKMVGGGKDYRNCRRPKVYRPAFIDAC